MTPAEMEWTKKVVTKDGTTQIELRGSARGSVVLIIVALDGYNHKWYKVTPDRWGQSTKGLNIHLAGNGGLQLTFEEVAYMFDLIANAKRELENLRDT